MTPEERAEQVTDILFQNGWDEKAERLVLMSASKKDLGGWSRTVVREQIESAIADAVKEEMERGNAIRKAFQDLIDSVKANGGLVGYQSAVLDRADAAIREGADEKEAR